MLRSLTARQIVYYILLLILVLTVFHLKFGLGVVLPGNDRWLYVWWSDMLPDICTWEYYRYSPLWEGAPGVFTGYGYPQTTGIGNTNIVPLIGMPLKLCNRWLPEHFQYLGFFLLSCYLLQAWFTDRLLAIIGVRSMLWRFAGVILAVVAAPLLDRFGHLALCAHWIILAGLCVYFDPRISRKAALWAYAVLGFVAIGTHPYLVLFPLLIAFADGLQYVHKRKQSWLNIVLFPAVVIVAIGLGAGLFGVFSLSAGGGAAEGFGVYSSNVNTFWNNMGKTTLSLLDMPAYGTGQYEGYAYLGGGVLLLWGSMLVQKRFYTLFARGLQRYWSLALVCGIALIYAWAFRLTWNEHLIFDPELGVRTFLYRMASIFRSSGRYIWLPYYLLLLLPLIYYSRLLKARPVWSAILLLLLVGGQLADLSKALTRCLSEDQYQVGPDWTNLVAISRKATTVYTFPLYQRTLAVQDDMQYLTGALAEQQIPITAGHLPRPDWPAQQQMGDSLQHLSDSGHWLLDPGGLLLTTPHDLAFFAALDGQSDIRMHRLGGYVLLYKVTNLAVDRMVKQLDLPEYRMDLISLAAYLSEHQGQNMIVVTADEASHALKPEMRLELQAISPVLSSLQFNEAYAAVWHKGTLLKERKTPKGTDLNMSLDLPASGGQGIRIRIRATSSTQHTPLLEVNGQAFSGLERGVNIFLFDDQMQLAEQRNFDLYRTYYLSR